MRKVIKNSIVAVKKEPQKRGDAKKKYRIEKQNA